MRSEMAAQALELAGYRLGRKVGLGRPRSRVGNLAVCDSSYATAHGAGL